MLDLELHTAAGPVIDLAAYLGQMEGGMVQGLGFTLTEAVLIKDGRFLTTNYDNYFMPTVRDAPERMRPSRWKISIRAIPSGRVVPARSASAQ